MEATGPALAEAVAGNLEPGVEGILVIGDDADLHHAIDGALRVGLDDPRFPPLHAWFPDDPFVDPERRIKLKVALHPRPSMSLAQTIGHSRAPSLIGPGVWGALDVGLVKLFADGHDPLKTVMVAGLRAGLDLEETRRFRQLPAVETQIDAEGRSARRIDGEVAPIQQLAKLSTLWVMNAQHLGELRPAPRAVPHDGFLDVGLGRGDQRDAEAWVRRMGRGEHVPDPQITELLVTRIEVRFSQLSNLILDQEMYRLDGFSVEVSRSPIALKV